MMSKSCNISFFNQNTIHKIINLWTKHKYTLHLQLWFHTHTHIPLYPQVLSSKLMPTSQTWVLRWAPMLSLRISSLPGAYLQWWRYYSRSPFTRIQTIPHDKDVTLYVYNSLGRWQLSRKSRSLMLKSDYSSIIYLGFHKFLLCF